MEQAGQAVEVRGAVVVAMGRQHILTHMDPYPKATMAFGGGLAARGVPAARAAAVVLAGRGPAGACFSRLVI